MFLMWDDKVEYNGFVDLVYFYYCILFFLYGLLI